MKIASEMTWLTGKSNCDSDKHIAEAGEDMGVMARRLYSEGLSMEQISEKIYAA